jgi:sulfur carrier protein
MLTIHLNGETRQVPPGTNVAQLIASMPLAGKRFAVEHNGEIVPKSRLGSVILDDSDRLEIVVAVGGG